MIDQLGGIQDTIKPMQDTLRQHELRPFEVIRSYANEIRNQKPSYQNPELSHVKLISASPFRATVKVQDHPDSVSDRGSEDEDFARDTVPQKSFLNSYAKERQSPIKDDSLLLRSHRDEILDNFHSAPEHKTTKSEIPQKFTSEPGDLLQGILSTPHRGQRQDSYLNI